MAPTKERRSKGRSKIEIKKIENQDRCHVTFSKRRTGLINKASELCVLCGAEIAIITASPGKKVFAFGHPSPDAVIDRYLLRGSCGGDDLGARAAAREAREGYAEAKRALLEAEQRREDVTEIWPDLAAGGKFLWEVSVEGMGLEDLEQFVQSLEEMRDGVREVLNKSQGSAAGGAGGSTSPESEIAAAATSPCLPPIVSNNAAALISEEMIKHFIS